MFRRALISYVLVAGLIGFDPVPVLAAAGGAAGLASGAGGAGPIEAEQPPLVVDLTGVDLGDIHEFLQSAEQTPDGLVADLPGGGLLILDATAQLVEIVDEDGDAFSYSISQGPNGHVFLDASEGQDVVVIGVPLPGAGDYGPFCIAAALVVVVAVTGAIIANHMHKTLATRP